MLIEYRKIEFPENDLMEAIACHDEATSQRLGEGDIVGIEFARGEKLEISVHVEYPENDGTGSIPLPVSFVTAAMIRYCIDEGVPVPKRGRKQIEFDDGTLSLVMRMTKATIANELDEEIDEDSEAA